MNRLLRRWEGLSIGVQLIVAFVVATAIMLWFHLGPLRQPFWRGVSYSVFWSFLGTVAIVGATRAEAAKRRQREKERKENPPNPRRHRVQ